MTEAQKEKNRIRAREWYRANRDRALANVAAYQQSNPDKVRVCHQLARAKNLEHHIATQVAWRKANAERYQALKDKWARDNPDKVKESAAKFRAANPGKNRDDCRKRRALKANLLGTFTQAQFKELCARYGNTCLACKNPATLTADHVIPVKFGGRNDIDNIQPLCQSCNSSKGIKSTDYRIGYDQITTKKEENV